MSAIRFFSYFIILALFGINGLAAFSQECVTSGVEKKKTGSLCKKNIVELKQAIGELTLVAVETTDSVIKEYLYRIINVVKELPDLLSHSKNRTLATCGIIPVITMELRELADVNESDNPLDFLIHDGCNIALWADQVYESVYQNQLLNPFRIKKSPPKKKCKHQLEKLEENTAILISTLPSLAESSQEIVLTTITQLKNLSEYIKKKDLTSIVCDTLAFLNYAVEVNLIDYIPENPPQDDPDFDAELSHYAEHIGAPVGALFTLVAEQRFVQKAANNQ